MSQQLIHSYSLRIFYFLYYPTLLPPVPSEKPDSSAWRETRYNLAVYIHGVGTSSIPHFRKYGLEYPRTEDDLYQETGLSYKRSGEKISCYCSLLEGERLDIELEEADHTILCAHLSTADIELTLDSHHPRLVCKLSKRD